MTTLVNSECQKKTILLSDADINVFLAEIKNWVLNIEKDTLFHEFSFKNYYETIAFVNAVAWIVHQEDHHPDIKVSYNKCEISFSTHSVKGLSKNDFICAAKINLLMSK